MSRRSQLHRTMDITPIDTPIRGDEINSSEEKISERSGSLEELVSKHQMSNDNDRRRRINSMVRPSMITPIRDAKGFFGQFPNSKRKSPIDPFLESIQVEDGAPVDRGQPVKCSLEDILTTVLPYDGPVRRFPQFDNLGSYIFMDDIHKALWRMEAERLLDVVKNPDRPLRFNSDGFFKCGDEYGYRELSRLCQRILTAMSLCLLDNECINVEYCSRLSNRGKLSKLIDQARMAQTTSELDQHEHQGHEQSNEENLDAIYCLINYISAVLARLITQTSPGHYWQTNVLGVLIKNITKIKILLRDLHANASIAVRSGELALEQSRSSAMLPYSTLDEEEECEEVLRMIEANEKEGLATVEEKEVALYCVNQNRFRSGVHSALRYILTSLRFSNRSGLSPTTFEMCAVVYETGLEGFKALLFQDRDHEYSATSDLDTLNTAHSAFNILNQTVTHINETQTIEDSRDSSDTCDLKTYMEWAYLSSENKCPLPDVDLSSRKTGPVLLRTMDDIITTIVPLATASPILVGDFTKFRTIIALTGDIRDDVQPYKEGQFSAFFRMYTDQFDKDIRQRDVLRLSQALDSGFFSRCSMMTGSAIKGFSESSCRNAETSNMVHKLKGLTKEMKDWVIDENSVTVQCRLYVWSVVALAMLFAGGGLAIGFSVGQRIKGVDPSNLSTYLWVLAGFIVLVCKSLQVKDWTWNDFLHRRVRCCSVSELHAVTGINEQLIIAKLLHDECGSSVLKIRGPYNSVFLKRSTDGFSIDRPIYMVTLLLSGLTLLKVVTPRGHALVCLDSRRGTDLRIVEHQGDQSKEHLVCEDINRLQERAKAENHLRLQLTRSNNLKWKRVQGIYNVMDAEFA